MPAWADQAAILAIYFLAETASMLFGVPYQVDHIVPLRSKLVCGLHVEHNLRVICKRSNIAKGNRTWPGKPS